MLGLISVNAVLHGGSGPCVPSGCDTLLRYRVAFPPRYVATTQEMMLPYTFQGGTCCPPPSVVLTAGPQPLAQYADYLKVMRSSDDCIFLWTIVPPTLAGAHDLMWSQIAGIPYTEGPIRTAHLGRFDAVLQDIELKGLGTRATAYVLSSGFAFYFHTCGPANRADLMTVLTAFDTNP